MVERNDFPLPFGINEVFRFGDGATFLVHHEPKVILQFVAKLAEMKHVIFHNLVSFLAVNMADIFLYNNT